MQTRTPTAAPIADATAAELRRAVPADAAAVQELTREAYAQWIPVIGREPMPMKADYHAALRDHLVDLLYAEGRLAALNEPDSIVRTKATSPVVFSRMVVMVSLSDSQAVDAAVPP